MAGRAATFSEPSNKIKGEHDVLLTKYSSYDDSVVKSPMRETRSLPSAADTTLLLDQGDGLGVSDIAQRSLSQRISASLHVKLPARLRSRAHALGRRRGSTRIDDSFIGVSKNAPTYVMTMDSDNLIE